MTETDFDPVRASYDAAGQGSIQGLAWGHGQRMLAAMPVRLSVEVGAARMRLRDILALAPGSVVELDRAADAPVDVKVNGTLIARGEIVATDGQFGIRLTEIVDDADSGEPQLERRA